MDHEKRTLQLRSCDGSTIGRLPVVKSWVNARLCLKEDPPGRILGKMGQKALALFNAYEAGLNYHIGFISRYVPFFKWPFPGFGLILPLGMAGVALTWSVSTRTKAL